MNRLRIITLLLLVLMVLLNAQTLFEVKDASDHSVFEITNDGIRIFNYPDTLMIISSAEIRANLDNSKGRGLSRSFSVSTNTTSKLGLANVLEVTTEATSMREGGQGNRYTDFSPENIFLGLNSGINTIPVAETSGQNNVFLGNLSGGVNISGAANVFVGYKSGFSNFDGHKNCFIGQESGYKNYSGIDNVFIGYQAGYNNYDGDRNVFLGYRAGVQNISGVRNVFIGYESGTSNGTGWGNTFVGEASGMANTDGYGNSYFGRNSAASISTGNYNTVMGNESIAANQSGNFNSCYGAFSGKWNYSSGSSNSLFGYQAGFGIAVSTNTYNNNSYFGTQSGFSTTTGSDNSYFGYQSGYSNNSGSGNVFIGHQAGYSETGSDKLYIDNSNTTQPLIYGDFDGDWVKINGDFSVLSNSDLNSVIIDQSLRVDGTSDLNGGLDVIGNTTMNGTLSITGNANLDGSSSWVNHNSGTSYGLYIKNKSATSPWHFYEYSTGNLQLYYDTTLRGTFNSTTGVYTSSSDKRFKKNIEDFTNIIDKVMLLHPKRYNFISQKNNDQKYIGLIAQDVKELFPEFVQYNEEDDKYTMDYAGLSVVAIQAIKEQQEDIDQLKAEIEEIKKLLRK